MFESNFISTDACKISTNEFNRDVINGIKGSLMWQKYEVT